MREYPHIAFISTSTMASEKNLTSCFARMYQGRYMAGVLAGMRTKSNVIGYVAAFPNAEVCRGINAFTFGVHRVNPDAKVVVMWTNAWENPELETAHAKRLVEECGADLLTYHQDDDATGRVAESYGLDFIAYNAILDGYSDHYLASITCRWNVYYKDILRRFLKGELVAIRNAWLGAREGIIDLEHYSKLVTPEMRTVISSVKNELTFNNNLIFYDEIYDNQGNLRCAKDQVITEYELLRNINWLVKGVEVLE
jgi:basic membrane protein A